MIPRHSQPSRALRSPQGGLYHKAILLQVKIMKKSATTIETRAAGFWSLPAAWRTILAIALFTLGLAGPAQAVAYRLYGLNFSPYIAGQDPNQGAIVSLPQLRQRLNIIAPYTRWVRTFGATHGLEETGRLAHRRGLKVAMGAWLGPVTTAAGLAANEAEISALIDRARRGQVDLAIVGSEALLRGDLTPQQLLAYIQRVKAARPGLKVTYADTAQQLLTHPEILAVVDVVFFNQYSYWEGREVRNAVATLHTAYQQLVKAAPGKRISVSESGWPTCGKTLGAAAPSLENANFYFLNAVSWARANKVNYFHFAAFDEGWKADQEGPQGACWGLWDQAGRLKPGMRPVFNGRRMGDNWSRPDIPGGPGAPAIAFTRVPPKGSDANLQGQALHVPPADYRIAVYIRVGSGWWTKPTAASPLTLINADGTWTCDITTGGNDPRANRIAAYLVPVGYTPSTVLGAANLPGELDQNALAKIEVDR